MTMIERVARALAPAGTPVNKLGERGYFRMARDAIAAMREPTDAMLYRTSHSLGIPIWQGMIDKALEEE